jgi:hypothetical protein
MYVCMYVYIYPEELCVGDAEHLFGHIIYISIHRERERERDTSLAVGTGGGLASR